MTTANGMSLEARGLTKAFGHVQALDGVSFSVEPGEVLAVLGDNGAGKSTLIKILSGVYDADGGQLLADGQAVRFRSPADSAAVGLATVYQDLALVDTRDVAANMFLGREFRVGPFVDRARMHREARSALDAIALKLPSTKTAVGLLSGGQRQAVAIARAVAQGGRLIIMDEPTAALGVTESTKVMDLIRRLRDQGRSVMVISHNLQQIWPVADRFLVMRLGRVAGVRHRAETSVDDLVRLIMYGAESEVA